MLKLQESKDLIANRSPMPPMYALLKRDSSVGENPFGNAPTPNRGEGPALPIIYGLCKNHCSEAGILHIVGDDESIPDDDPTPMIVREFSVDQLEADDLSDVQSNSSKKIHNNPFVECDGNGEFSFNDSDDDNPIQDLFKEKDQKMAEDLPKVRKSSKKSRKDRKRGTKNAAKPVNGSKRIKLEENKEHSQSKKPSLHSSQKDMCKKTGTESTQKSRNVSTKNGKVGHVRKNVTGSSTPDLINIQKSIKEPKMKVQSTNGDLTLEGRKSLRLRKRESNLEECKGCTCKKSQCIKLYCECFLSKGFCSPSCSCED